MNGAFTPFRGWRAAAACAIPACAMTNHPPSRAGGAILAGAIIAGAVAGVIAGQPSVGFLVGAAAGALVLLILWLQDRRR